MGERKLPGEKILERLEARTRRRPRIGFVPEFYARLGMSDPWSGGDAAAAESEGLVFLSAMPFYQMLGRLARARMRREKRTERFLNRRAGVTMRASTRRMPGEAPLAALPFAGFGSRTLADDAMRVVVPQAAVAPIPADGEAPTLGGSRTVTIEQAWLDTPYVPARVAKPTQLDRAGERLRTATASARVDAALSRNESPVTSRRALTRAVLVEEAGQVQIQRVVRHRAGPVVREIVEEIGAPRIERSVRRAGGRATGTSGLRPVLAASPSLSVSSGADVHHAMAMAQAVPERLERARPAEARRASAATRTARERVTRPTRSLSASPIAAINAAATPAARVVRAAQPAPEPGRPGQRLSARAASRIEALREPEGTIELEGFAARASARSARPSGSSLVPRFAPATPTMSLPPREKPAVDSGLPTAATAVTTEGAYIPARVARTAALAANAARVVRTGATAWASARSATTPEGGFVGARSATTGATDFTGARTGGPADSRFVGARSGTTPATEHIAARSATTPDGRFVGARTATTGDSEYAGARSGVTGSSDYTGARSSVTGASPFVGARAGVTGESPFATARIGRTPAGTWSGARTATTPGSEFEGAPVGHTPAAVWAAARLARGETSSLLPRMSPASPAVVLPKNTVAPAPGPVERIVAAEDAWASPVSTPARRVRTATTPFVAARVARTVASAEVESPTVSAAARSFRSPSTTRTATRALPGETAIAPALTGPIAYARGLDSTARRVRTPQLPYARATFGAAGAPMEIIRAIAEAVAEGQNPLAAVRTPEGRYIAARVAKTMATEWASARSSTTPDGRFTGARSATTGSSPWTGARSGTTGASALTGARGLRTPDLAYTRASMVRTPDGTWVPMEGQRTPDSLFRGASQALTPDGTYVGASVARTRPTDWAGARSGITDATAFRGAFATRTPDGTYVNAATTRTPSGSFDPAGRYTTAATAWEGARTGAPGASAYTPGRRRAASPFAPAAPEMTLPDQPGVDAPTARRRATVESTLGTLAEGSTPANAPSWAARANGQARVRSSDGLYEALAKADTTNEVVRVIFERAEGLRRSGSVPEPIRQIVQEIQREVVQVPVGMPTLSTERPMRVETPQVTNLSRSSGPARSTTRRVRSSALPTAPSGKTAASGRNDRLSKLVKRLTDLIHLAENQQLLEAKRQVRLAEDTPSARAEGQGPQSTSGNDPKDTERVDLDALTREVVHEVTRLLELNRERHSEDSDESNWW